MSDELNELNIDDKESAEQRSRIHEPAPASEEGRHGAGMSITFVVGILITVAAVAYIIIDGADDAVFAYTVDQAATKVGELEGKKFRVRGTVLEGTVKHKPGTLDTRFDLVHEGETITVSYDKPLPDTFKAGIEVIAEGELGQDGALEADNVIAKCPSKYEGGPPTAKGGEAHPGGAGGDKTY